MRRNFLMMGQSNMCDRGVASELPSFQNSSRMFVYRRVQPVGTAAEIDVEGTWEQAVDVVDEAGAVAGSAGALALSFANKVCDSFPEDEVGLVPRSWPGIDINQFRKHNRKSGLYGMAIQRAWWAESTGPISGLLFWQGEQDGYSSTNAAAWSERFGRLVSDIRVDLGNLNLPVVFVRLGNDVPSGIPYWNTVRDQQEWIRMKNVARVDIDDVTPNADKLHYPTASYLTIGERIADAMAPML